MRRVCLVCLLGLVCAPAWAQTPAGGEFQVNTYTTGYQATPAVAIDANGDFVVVWESDLQDGDGSGIRWRKFNSAGVGQGGGGANTFTTGDQNTPAVAMDPNGNFVVVWTSDGQDGSGRGIFARRFDATGTAQGAEFKVNGHTGNNQFVPAVAAAANGNFVVAWESRDQDGDDYGIFARLFDSGGNSIAAVQVNTYTTGFQGNVAAAIDPNGNFVVVWNGVGASDDDGVFARLYDASGSPVGGQFRVNAYTTFGQGSASVAMAANGSFVVTWEGTGEGDGSGIFGRRFGASGTAQGSEFLINAYTTDNQFGPAVAMDKNGDFVVTWYSFGQDGDLFGIAGRMFDPSGVPQGSEFLANSYTTGQQRRPAVAADPDGDFVVAWDSQGQDGSDYGVFAQRYGDLIFADNFESGGTGRWTTSLTDGTDLDVTAGSALAGTTRGLRALVNDTNSIYVQDDTPSAETRYRARFYFDPNDIDPGEAQGHQRIRIFLAHDALSQRVVTIVLKRLSGQYSVEARARQNDGSRVDTGFFDITNAPHFVEFDWQRATGPGAGNGALALLVDNTPVSTLTGLDTDLMRVEDGRLGAMSVKTGAAGTLHFDEFESRRFNPIGPF
jgi:hypothetical protein